MIEKLAIIGVGLIGGSFAKALKKAKKVKHVIGYGRQLDNLQTALDNDVIDEYTQDIKVATTDADVIFIATPVSTYESLFKQIQPYLKSSAIITDAGSTKQNIIQMAKEAFGKIPDFYVPGHPIAGTENSGAAAAFAELYQQHKVILTPLKHTNKKALELITQLWQATGADVVLMDPEHHDIVLGATSHLPHVLAYTLVHSLTTLNEKKEILEYAAGGFKDFTRIASSNPKMWQDICFANKDVLLEHLAHFQKDLNKVITALETDDKKSINDLFSRAKSSRDKLIQS